MAISDPPTVTRVTPGRRHAGSRPTRPARRGVILVLIVALLAALILVAFLAMEVAYMQLVQTQLRAATDAAARAGVEALSRTQDIDVAREAARAVARRNRVAGVPLELDEDEIIFGSSLPQANGNWSFTPGGTPVNAVRVVGNRTRASLSGSVPLLSGGLMGRDDFEPAKAAVAAHLERDICLVVDRSGSMSWDLDGGPWSYPPPLQFPEAYCELAHPTESRWAALSVAVQAFIDACQLTHQEEQLALVSYASPGTWCGTRYNASDIDQRLTTNYRLIEEAMERLWARPIAGGTSISAGIDDGVRVLTDRSRTRPLAHKTMVLLTDGHHNHGRSPLLSAAEAASQQIVIHTVTFSVDADQAQMREVARITGGRHYHAPSASELERIFREIAFTSSVVMIQ